MIERDLPVKKFYEKDYAPKRSFFPEGVSSTLSHDVSALRATLARGKGLDLSENTVIPIENMIQYAPFIVEGKVRAAIESVLEGGLSDHSKVDIGVFPIHEPVCSATELFFYENHENELLKRFTDQSVIFRIKVDGIMTDVKLMGVNVMVKDDGFSNKMGFISNTDKMVCGLSFWIVSPTEEPGEWRLRRPFNHEKSTFAEEEREAVMFGLPLPKPIGCYVSDRVADS